MIFNEELLVQASENILQIAVFDITGKLIKKEDPSNLRHEFKSAFNFIEGIYMIKIKLENGITMTEKLINRK